MKYFILCLALLVVSFSYSQTQTSVYTMDFVRAVQFTKNDKNTIWAFFHVSPVKQRKFELVLSMRLSYSLGDSSEAINVPDLTKQNKVGIAIYGNNMEEEDKFRFNLIKDKISINKNDFVLCFEFRNVTAEKIDNMSMIYGLWESRRSRQRIEKKYNFTVEKIDTE